MSCIVSPRDFMKLYIQFLVKEGGRNVENEIAFYFLNTIYHVPK